MLTSLHKLYTKRPEKVCWALKTPSITRGKKDYTVFYSWANYYYSRAPYSYRKEKGTHELIFSWLSWLAVLLVGAYARRRQRRWRRSHATWRPYSKVIGWQRHALLVYRALLWYWTSMLWSIDTCQSKVSADQYHVTISRAQDYSSLRWSTFLKLTADQVLAFSIGLWAHVRWTCWKQGRIVRKPVKANPGLKVNRIITFFPYTSVFLKLKTEG